MIKLNSFFQLSIVKNSLWLYVLQMFNTVFPLITIPYITRILGSDQYGIYSISLNFIGYLQVLVEYGFGLSGSRKIAVEKNHQKQETIYSRIFWSRVVLCSFSFLLLLIISFITHSSKAQVTTNFLLFIMVIGSVFEQNWLFQGLESMQYITVISVITRILSVLSIFMLVKNIGDIYKYSFISASVVILNGLISIVLVKRKFGFKIHRVFLKDIKQELIDGWYMFTTSMMSKVFTGISITILAIFGSSEQVGGYSAIQKIPTLLSFGFSPISQALFPYVSKYFENSFTEGIGKVKFMSKIIIPVFIIVGIIIMIFSKVIVNILFGSEYLKYSEIVIPLIVWMILSIINNFMGIQTLVASGHLKEYSRAFNIGSISIVFLNIIMGYFWNINGVAFATMISEFVLSLCLIYQLRKLT